MAKSRNEYTGKIKVGSGPVPIQRWADRSRPRNGEDLRAEEVKNPHPKENGSARPMVRGTLSSGD